MKKSVDELFEIVNNNQERKDELIAQSKKNLREVIKFYMDNTNELGVSLDIENDCPYMSYYMNNTDDDNKWWIEHISFTDRGELADVTLQAADDDFEMVLPAYKFWDSDADFDEVAFAILSQYQEKMSAIN